MLTSKESRSKNSYMKTEKNQNFFQMHYIVLFTKKNRFSITSILRLTVKFILAHLK